MDIQLKLTEGIAPGEEEAILDRLKTYNIERFGKSDRRELAIPIYDEEGNVTGGLVGYTGRGWLYVSMLYVPEALRGQGLAGRMLEMAEAEARARGCIGAYIDSMNPNAVEVYRRHGYVEIGSLKDLAGGHAVTWMQKRL